MQIHRIREPIILLLDQIVGEVSDAVQDRLLAVVLPGLLIRPAREDADEADRRVLGAGRVYGVVTDEYDLVEL